MFDTLLFYVFIHEPTHIVNNSLSCIDHTKKLFPQNEHNWYTNECQQSITDNLSKANLLLNKLFVS